MTAFDPRGAAADIVVRFDGKDYFVVKNKKGQK